MSLLVIVLFFVVSFSVAAAVVFAGIVWMRSQQKERREQSKIEQALGILKSEELSSISLWHDLLARFDFVDFLGNRLAQADLAWSVGRVTMAMLLLGTVALVIVWGVSWIPAWFGLILIPAGVLTPYLCIDMLRNRRFNKFREIFPDALDSFARALRAGSPVAGGLDLMAEEADPPVSAEMRKTFVEVNLGVSWDRALENLAKRVPLQEVNLFVTALQIHSRTGGKLGEVMTRLSEYMREQNSLQGEVRAVAAHGKLTGLILTLLPMGIAFMMFLVAPDYILTLFDHPWGKHMIAAAALCLVLAHLIIGRIVKVEV